MRRDIQVNTQTGDMVLKDSVGAVEYPFEWVNETDQYLFGQVTLPSTFEVSQLPELGVKVQIPYTPIYKPMKVKFVRMYGTEHSRTVINPVNGSEWFDVRANLFGQQNMTPYASQLLIIDADTYTFQTDMMAGAAYVWSGTLSDARNINANIQNRNLLLKCVPSNSYRYPTSGVGLVRYLHANLSRTGLADKLQTEFEADGVKVITAAFNTYTGDLDLELDFSKADASV